MAEEDYEEKPHVVIDFGTCYTKAGLIYEEGPRAVFPSAVGYPKFAGGTGGKKYYIGKDAEDKRSVFKLNYPIEKGLINNWDDYEKILGHILTDELNVAPEEHNIMLTESPNNTKKYREEMAKLMFEIFNVPG